MVGARLALHLGVLGWRTSLWFRRAAISANVIELRLTALLRAATIARAALLDTDAKPAAAARADVLACARHVRTEEDLAGHLRCTTRRNEEHGHVETV